MFAIERIGHLSVGHAVADDRRTSIARRFSFEVAAL
jgi:hypothetical protein